MAKASGAWGSSGFGVVQCSELDIGIRVWGR